MKKSYFNLSVDAPLFKLLSSKPLWWLEIIENTDLYCNIRKDNRINIYYRGASIMSLYYKNGKVVAGIHNYYLGFDKPLCEKMDIKYGNVELRPEEIVCRIPTIKKRVEANKKNIACFEGEEVKGKNFSSEKYIQSQMYIKDSTYIDTEFALRLDDGTDIRIDLVKLSKEGEVCFEELKLIDDSRLKPKRGKRAEIRTQMDSYERFLKEAAKLKGSKAEPIIVEYYTKVLQIMDKIGVLRTNLEPMSVRDYVSLYIEQTYVKKHFQRDIAIKTIQEVCKGLHSNIEDVIRDYNSI